MNTPVETIRREIARRGVLPFARFMELALYCPNSGYYEMEKDSPGRRGDFFTSVSTGELFGQLLAFQFSEWLEELSTLNPQPSTLNSQPVFASVPSPSILSCRGEHLGRITMAWPDCRLHRHGGTHQKDFLAGHVVLRL